MHQRKVFIVVGVVVVIVCALLLFYGASIITPPNSTSPGMTQTASAVPYTTLVQSTQTKITTRANYLITSQDELTTLWQMIMATGTPPTVDFSQNEVLAVFSGNPKSLAVQVSRIQDGSARDVLVTIVTPDGSCTPTTGAIPYELVAVPSTTLALTHQDFVAVTTCPKK